MSTVFDTVFDTVIADVIAEEAADADGVGSISLVETIVGLFCSVVIIFEICVYAKCGGVINAL